MHIQNNDITPATSDILSLINSTLLTADTILGCKKFCSQLIFFSFSIEKNTIFCSYISPFVPPKLHVLNLIISYLVNSLAAVVTELALYRILTFHVPNLMSFSVA